MTDIVSLFHDKTLLNKALQLSSHGKRAGYERLEFLGDRVVGLVVAEMLYTLFPREPEGPMAKRFVSLVREETLALVAKQIGLPLMLITHEDMLRQNASILSDVCEAILGALYLDRGIDVVREFMKPIWTPLILSEIQVPQDPKSALQEWAQKRYKELPVYKMLDRKGPDHQPIFNVSVSVAGHTIIGQGTNKRSAEQAAADTFLKEIQHG